MSYLNNFCEGGIKCKESNRIERRPDVGADTLCSNTLLHAPSCNAEFSRRKPCSEFQSVRLSVTDLLQRVEKQAENSTKLFPLLDKEKYQRKKKVPSVSKESLEDISSYYDSYYDRMQNTCYTDPFADMDAFIKAIDNEYAGETQQNIRGTSRRESSIVKQHVNVKRFSVPALAARELQTECNLFAREKKDCNVTLSVRIEYMALSNKLRVNVSRFGSLPNEKGKKKFDNLVAKVCLFPGKLQKQKTKVSNDDVSLLGSRGLYFRGILSPDLIQKEIGVGIYLRQGVFRKPRLIYEWKISMEKFDFMEPVTVSRKMNCHF